MSEHSGGPSTVGSTSPYALRPEASPAGRPASPQSSGDADWTQQVTDLIVDSVDKVRDKTTGPILEVTHSAVHAVVALILVLPILVLATIGMIRLLDWAIPGDIWIVYAGVGTFCSLLGVLLWSRRTSPS